jgi:hypothetical protein
MAIALSLFSYKLTAQYGIGTLTPDASAIVDVSSTTKGFLPPRLYKGVINNIQSPAEGLTAYCINCCTGGTLTFYNGDKWVYLREDCMSDVDGDHISDQTDIDADNDGIIDTNETANIAFFEDPFGSASSLSGGCARAPLSAPNYSGISYAGTGNVTDGHYALINKTSCGAPFWPSSPIQSDNSSSGNNGYFILVNAPNNGNEVVYGREITNIPHNSTLNVSLFIANIAPNLVDKPDLKFRFVKTNGVVLDSVNTGDITNGNWQKYTLKLDTKTDDTLNFEIVNNCACGQAGNDFAIDDLEIRIKYGDLDGDNIPDNRDQDSDGDGIPDIIEAQGHPFNLPTGNDSDGDGLDDAYETAGIINPPNTDAASENSSGTYPNYLDTDSDNDGISDTQEAGLTLTGNDSDGDGLDDAVDNTVGPDNPYGIFQNYTFPDSDSDGTPDYIDNN